MGLGFVYPVLYNQNPVAKTIATVKQYQHIYGYNIFNPGYRFYLDKNIPTTNSITTLQQWLNTPNAIVITRTTYLDKLKVLPLQEIKRHHDIFESPTTVILKNNARP